MDQNFTFPPIPENEPERIRALRSYGVLDTAPELNLDAITQLASQICDTPIAMISLIDENRQWFKSRVGFNAEEFSRSQSFCQYSILGDELFIVPNAKNDERFANNPMVSGKPHLCFYAGAPLIDPNGFKLGALCVLDKREKELSDFQKNAMKLLANQVVSHFILTKRSVNWSSQMLSWKIFSCCHVTLCVSQLRMGIF
ncbi:MAG: GAF domain-containing protein [Bacteroidetes bacterium]|nr:GAF domain-containing protein [Bacteroidota bacterium]